MDYIDKEALSVPEAVFAAARVLGIDEKDAQVVVLSAPGARRVKVRVGKPGVALPAYEAAPEARDSREERDDRDDSSSRPERAPREDRGPRRDGRGGGESRGDFSPQPAMQRTPPTDEQAGRAKTDLEKLLAAMGTPSAVELKHRAANVVLNIAGGEHESLLIGRRGQTAEALQLLINEFMGRREGDPTLYLVVDVADYHGRAEERLIEKAKGLAAQVLAEGGEASMGQLSPPERRVVHMTIKEMEGVESFSVGSGSVKKMVIKKKD